MFFTLFSDDKEGMCLHCAIYPVCKAEMPISSIKNGEGTDELRIGENVQLFAHPCKWTKPFSNQLYCLC